MEGESANPVVFGAIFLLTSFVLGIIGFVFKIMARITEVGRECHERINANTKEIYEVKGYLKGKAQRND